MRLDNLAGLMAPRASQTRHTRPREVFTSSLMASLSINLWCTKREISLVNSFIPPLHFLLLLGSSECFLTFSLCNCVSPLLSQANSLLTLSLLCFCPSTLTGDFSAFPLDFSPALRLFRALPSAFQPPLRPPPSTSAFFHHAKRKGEVKERSLYYNALSRHGRLSPSQLALIVARISGPRHNSQGSSEPPRHPLTPSMEIAWLKRKHHHRASALLFPLVFCPPRKSIHRTRCMAMTTAWWRRKSPQAGRWRRTR
jgi:hypothetical protein